MIIIVDIVNKIVNDIDVVILYMDELNNIVM